MSNRKPTERIRKITIKTVCGGVDFDKLVAAKEKRLDLMTLFGVARLARPGSSDYGMYTAFLGEFVAVNMETGEEFGSSKLLVPKILEEQLAGLVGQEGGREVKFAVVIGVRYEPKSQVKYEFTLRPLVETADASVIAELREVAMKALPLKK